MNMKKLSIMLACIGAWSAVTAQTLPEGTPAQTNIPEADYPCVDASSRATFRLDAPEARSVQVDICGKKWLMTKNPDGVWSVTTDPLVVGFHYYFLLVDGVAVNDPASETFFGCGKMASGIEIPESPEQLLIIRMTSLSLMGRYANAIIILPSNRKSADALSILRQIMRQMLPAVIRYCTCSMEWARTNVAGAGRGKWLISSIIR